MENAYSFCVLDMCIAWVSKVYILLSKKAILLKLLLFIEIITIWFVPNNHYAYDEIIREHFVSVMKYSKVILHFVNLTNTVYCSYIFTVHA